MACVTMLIYNKEVTLIYSKVKKKLQISYLEDILIDLTWEMTG